MSELKMEFIIVMNVLTRNQQILKVMVLLQTYKQMGIFRDFLNSTDHFWLDFVSQLSSNIGSLELKITK